MSRADWTCRFGEGVGDIGIGSIDGASEFMFGGQPTSLKSTRAPPSADSVSSTVQS